MLSSVDVGDGERLALEATANERSSAERVHAELRTPMRERNVYRGRVLELRPRHFHDDEGVPLTVRTLPEIARERIVLPTRVLEQVERQALGIARHAVRLRSGERTCAAACCCTDRRA